MFKCKNPHETCLGQKLFRLNLSCLSAAVPETMMLNSFHWTKYVLFYMILLIQSFFKSFKLIYFVMLHDLPCRNQVTWIQALSRLHLSYTLAPQCRKPDTGYLVSLVPNAGGQTMGLVTIQCRRPDTGLLGNTQSRRPDTECLFTMTWLLYLRSYDAQ